MTKEEYKEQYERLMFEKLTEQNLEKRKLIEEKIKLLRRKYTSSLMEERLKQRRK